MLTLRVSLFGGFRMHQFDTTGDIKTTSILQSLLAYLLLFRHRTHTRDIILEIFWGDYDQQRARACLNTALWRLRQVLEPEGLIERGTYLISNPVGDIGFNCDSSYWLDVAEFERVILPILNKPLLSLELAHAEQLVQGLSLYHGELLEGFYDDWAVRERERYREIYLNALYCLMQYYAQQHRYSDSLRCGQNILRSDPLREHIHRDMMQLYLNSGQREQAIQQYFTCKQILATELGIAPLQETDALFAQLQGKPPSVTSPDIRGELNDLLGQVAEVQQRILNLVQRFDDPRH